MVMAPDEHEHDTGRRVVFARLVDASETDGCFRDLALGEPTTYWVAAPYPRL